MPRDNQETALSQQDEALPAGEEPAAAGPAYPASKITAGTDGKYRWMYDYNLYKRPQIFFLIWKICAACSAFPALVLFFSELGRGFFSALAVAGQIYALVLAIMTVLFAISYFLIYAPIVAGHYCVVFEMDDNSVTHRHMASQFKKIQALSLRAVLAGCAQGSPTVAGAGLLSATKQSTTSRFRDVRTITVDQKHETIKIRTKDMVHNQVFVAAKEFSFVLDFILSRCPSGTAVRYR
jgi:hypothetical protein